jgi:hypothetical protein
MSEPTAVDVRTYEGKTHADAARAYADDAPIAAEAGLDPISQRWAGGRITARALGSLALGVMLVVVGSLLLRAHRLGPIEAAIVVAVGVVLVYVGAMAARRPGHLVVTYRRRAP